MAKTLAGVKPEYTAAAMKNLPADCMANLDTFVGICAVARGESEAGYMMANASKVFDFAKFVDQLADMAKMGKEALEVAMARYSEAHGGEVPDGFRWHDNGCTTKIIDVEGLIKNLVINEGKNEDTIRAAMTITMKALSEATGLTEKCIIKSSPECFEIKQKKATLQRTSN